MKKLITIICAVAILVLPGCCCKRSNAPKARTHKKVMHKKKHVVKKHKSVHKKHHAKKMHHKKHHAKKKHKKHAHIELDNTDSLFT